MAYISATSAATLGVLGVLAVGGGTVVTAQQAQPGDLLYPLRVTVSGEAGTHTDLEALVDTYNEAASLEAEGDLSADARADLSDRYRLHLNNVQEAIAELEAEGELEAAAALRTQLRASLREVGSFFEDDTSSASSSEDSSSADSADSSSAESSVEGSVRIDADASAGASVRVDGDEDVRVESHDSDDVHYESSDGSVRIDADADATSTVNINQN